ncbi:hypothetical protein Tsubulata_019499 [Turnera subulata]|uniref:ADP-ribosyl cyclase/cyclic ADP-ribose hydrolase n=1 Tax=Turnera subulata TaxID=218843 RepID=A0A9Q0F194_9ROSI|nr:hypothetical protein Tsubulata_019499 [Turnera subulata]
MAASQHHLGLLGYIVGEIFLLLIKWLLHLPQEKHDVFISFRGEDHTQQYHQPPVCSSVQELKVVSTFIDYKIDKGQELAPSLLKAIEDSKLSIVIFSQDYASSKWCLDELAHIMECNKKTRELKYQMEKVQSWREALSRAANIAGWDSLAASQHSST